ncbi:MAG TPA: alpha/beta fold hydrolase, partial [Verrucomicrobiae bacterium]|nr:alpha/beta fold hydrolase [Verrucomicrobiae bacterium]
GGDSLLAARLFARIEKHFGKKLPLTLLFESPTIEHLANMLREGAPPATPSLLLPIQAGGSRPPLFLVHGAGGGMLWGYANLAQHLDPQQPVYGIESRGLKGLEEFARIEEMAAEYIREMRTFQPADPYYLGGYCFGGNVAYEMARQLHALGKQVALLALFESVPTNGSYYCYQCWRPRFIRDFIRNIFYRMQDLFRMKPEARRNFVRRKIMALNIVRRFGLVQATPAVDLEKFIDISALSWEEIKLWQCHLRIAEQYMEQPYAGRITLFRTRRQPFLSSFDPTYAWSDLAAGGVSVRMVPGSHENVFAEPNVGWLAEQLKAVLAETQAAATIPS